MNAMQTIYKKIADELHSRRDEALASAVKCEKEDPRLVLFYKGKAAGLTSAMNLMLALQDGHLPAGVTHSLEYWQAATDRKQREAADFVAFCQERIQMISDHYTEYGTSRGRAMIEAYQAAINYAKGGDLLINCLGEIDDGAALDAFMESQEGGEE